MKLFNKHIFFYLLTALLVSGCSKSFLEVEPKGKLIAGKTADYELMLNNPVLYLPGPAAYMVMSDELAGIEPLYSGGGLGIGGIIDQKAFSFQDDIYLPEDNNTDIAALVRHVYSYNAIINEVMDSKEGTDAQKKSILAEALAGRAFAWFMMVNYYAPPYNAATAATDAGIPLTLKADATETKFSRATVQEVYDHIIRDLEQAIPDLPVTLVSRIRLTRAGGEAILGKVYAFMGKFDKALPLLNAAVTDLSNSTISVGLFDYNAEFQAGGIFYPINPFMGPATPDAGITDKQVLYLKRAPNYYKYYFGAVVLSPETVSLYTTSDLRKNFHTGSSFGMAVSYPLGMQRAWGSYWTNVGVSVPDIHLLRAECKARLNDLSGAAADMEAFRKMRMDAADAPVPAAIAADQVSLTKFILDERIREFAMDGYRWFDMRRLSVDPVYRSTVKYEHRMYDAETGNVLTTYTLKPERLTMRFPPNIIAANPGFEQNK